MVVLKKKTLGGKKYYYLEHSLRQDGRIIKKEKYIGKELPKNIDKLKTMLLSEILAQKWHPLFDKIKKNHAAESKATPKEAMKKNLHAFSVRFTYDSQKIEGSKLTLRETANLLENSISPKEKPIDDAKEALAHQRVFYQMLAYEKESSRQVILYWHKKLLEATGKEIAGRIREHQVMISGSKFIPPFPAEIPALLNKFFKWYHNNKEKIHPVELAGLAHLKFVTIHPFTDGNGRISRLIMNFVLNKHNYPLLNIAYEKRTGYYNALERAQVKKENNVFVQWLFRRYADEYRRFLKNSI